MKRRTDGGAKQGIATEVQGVILGNLIVLPIVGALVGWLVFFLLKNSAMGLAGHIASGITGALIAGLLLPAIGVNFGAGFIGSGLNGLIGAALTLSATRLLGGGRNEREATDGMLVSRAMPETSPPSQEKYPPASTSVGREPVKTAVPPEVSKGDVRNHLPRKVFIVHGHGAIEQEVARFLDKIGIDSIILNEMLNKGQTILEKFEAHSDVGFAVVLLTPDDVGGKAGDTQQNRARQNVILEWGYFAGKLGRQNVCVIKRGDVEMPSDLLGMSWTPFEGHWKIKLAQELEGAGFDMDWQSVSRAT